jgi:hypothetical protein
MALMAGRTASFALLLSLLLAGCGSSSPDVPAACLAGADTIERALQGAPAAVTLTDGTRLSTCLSRARSDSELQTLGASLMQVADRLRPRARTDDAAALRLGYLRGAARRGVKGNPGLADNLGRRLEQTTLLPRGSASAAALDRGVRAGESGG